MSTTPIDYMVYFWRVAQLSMMFVCAIRAMGAPYLRFLQGRVAILPTRPFCTPRTNRVAYAFVVPPFANCAKDGAPTFIAHAGKIKAWGTAAADVQPDTL